MLDAAPWGRAIIHRVARGRCFQQSCQRLEDQPVPAQSRMSACHHVVRVDLRHRPAESLFLPLTGW